MCHLSQARDETLSSLPLQLTGDVHLPLQAEGRSQHIQTKFPSLPWCSLGCVYPLITLQSEAFAVQTRARALRIWLMRKNESTLLGPIDAL